MIHIHAPRPTDRAILCKICPDCKRRSRFTAVFTEWYGWDVTCLRCGRNWQGGEWMPLPFTRQARQQSVGAAKRRWRLVFTEEGEPTFTID